MAWDGDEERPFGLATEQEAALFMRQRFAALKAAVAPKVTPQL